MSAKEEEISALVCWPKAWRKKGLKVSGSKVLGLGPKVQGLGLRV